MGLDSRASGSEPESCRFHPSGHQLAICQSREPRHLTLMGAFTDRRSKLITTAVRWNCYYQEPEKHGQSPKPVSKARTLSFQFYQRADTLYYFGGLSHYTSQINVINGLMVSSLSSPNSIRRSAVDTWGNPKIPSPRSILNQTNDDLSLNPWQTVNPATTSYASLIGVPIYNTPAHGSATFTIEYPVFATDCKWQHPGIGSLEWCQLSGPLLLSTDPDTNTTCVLNKADGSVRGPYYGGGSFLTSQWSNKYIDIIYSIADSHKVGNVWYQGSRADCILKTTHLEAEIICTNGACGVTRLRRSEKELQPDNLTPVSSFGPSSSPNPIWFSIIANRTSPK